MGICFLEKKCHRISEISFLPSLKAKLLFPVCDGIPCSTNLIYFVSWDLNSCLLFLQCTKKCGNGFKVRDVICQQLLALGELANKPDRDCPIGKPDAREACNNQPCPFSDISRIQGQYKMQVFLLSFVCPKF